MCIRIIQGACLKSRFLGTHLPNIFISCPEICMEKKFIQVYHTLKDTHRGCVWGVTWNNTATGPKGIQTNVSGEWQWLWNNKRLCQKWCQAFEFCFERQWLDNGAFTLSRKITLPQRMFVEWLNDRMWTELWESQLKAAQTVSPACFNRWLWGKQF